jgi:hypothetical protein
MGELAHVLMKSFYLCVRQAFGYKRSEILHTNELNRSHIQLCAADRALTSWFA